jgi:hypothetical protein
MVNRLCFISLTVFLVFLMGSCQKEEKKGRDYPQIRTLAVDHITSEGARFNAEIISGSTESITEYGFVWDKNDFVSINISEKVTTEDSPETNGFSNEITFALEEMKEYYVRSYIKADGIVIYGDMVKFMSLGSMAPEITGFEPTAASWGDTVTIYGKNFSFVQQSNSVHFGNLTAKIVSCNSEFLKVEVPDLTSIHSEVSVEVLGNLATTPKLFELITPGKIISVDRKNIAWGDTLLLTGIFPFSEYSLKVLMDSIPVVVLESNETKMKIVVPATLVYCDSVTVDLSIDNHIVQAVEKNHMIPPFISSIESRDFGWTDTITVLGLFKPVISANKLLFSGTESKIIEITHDRIRCIVPDNGSNHSATLQIETDGIDFTYPTTLSLSGPLIEKITPSAASAGTRLEITGKYFREEATTLIIQGQSIYCLVSNSRKMGVSLPHSLGRGSVPVTVKVYDKQNTYNNLLTLLKPAISDFNPKEATFGDIITVSGLDFDPDNIKVSFEEEGALFDVLEKSATGVKFAVPNDGVSQKCRIYLTTSGTTVYASQLLTLFDPRLDLVAPMTGKPGDVIRITGDYFNPVNSKNEVYVDGTAITAISSSRNYIDFTIPKLLGGDYAIQVWNGTGTTTYPEALHCITPWKKLVGYNDPGRFLSSCFLSNGNIWRIGGFGTLFSVNSDISIYSLDNNSMSQINSETGTANTFAFEVGGNGYFGLGVVWGQYGDIYSQSIKKINLTDHSITDLPDFPGAVRKYAFSFSLLSKGFIGSGMNSNGLLGDFWKFDPGTGAWIQLDDLPFGNAAGASAFTINNKAYVIAGKDCWEYDPTLDSWNQKADFPGTSRYHGTGFSIADKLYFGTGSEKLDNYDYPGNNWSDFWQYNSSNDSWTRLIDFPMISRTGAYGISYNGKGYIGGGLYYMPYGEYFYYATDLMEYDPSNE